MNKIMQQFCDMKKEHPDHYNEVTTRSCSSPITLLIGPNGTGKSMSLRHMKESLKRRKIDYVEYSTSKDDIVQKGSNPFTGFDPYKLACAFHSEGERMIDSFGEWADTVFVRAVLEHKRPLWVFIDEADSGLSIDRLWESLRQIVNIIGWEHFDKKREIHLVATCNSYEMLEVMRSKITDIIWVPTKQKIKVKSYESFKKRYMEYSKEMCRDE